MDSLSLPELAKEYQEYLEELLQDKRWYQTPMLKGLRVPFQYIQLYQEIFDYEASTRKDEELDMTIGMKLLDDKNSIYCSIHIYKHLWVIDHY